ncbi:MAG TPA: DNA-binding protein [Acidimicrobiaceae bacterium]|nr:DNA-binding protein [Acidimicrobiaceae bacterium]
MTGPGDRPGDPAPDGATAGYRDIGINGRLLFRVEEAAEVLAIGTSTVYKLLAAGELKGIKIGRSLRITASELGRFVEGFCS